MDANGNNNKDRPSKRNENFRSVVYSIEGRVTLILSSVILVVATVLVVFGFGLIKNSYYYSGRSQDLRLVKNLKDGVEYILVKGSLIPINYNNATYIDDEETGGHFLVIKDTIHTGDQSYEVILKDTIPPNEYSDITIRRIK